MKYLVTGGAGFIGSHLVHTLLEEGHSVVVYDNFTTGKIVNLEPHLDLQIVIGDIRDSIALAEASADIDGIFHLAAVVQVQKSVDNPLITESVNTLGTSNVLQVARQNNVKVVLSSSASVYKTSNKLLTEAGTLNPMSPYALSKLHNEQQAKLFNDLYNVDTVSLRYFNVYGDRQDASSPYSGVISVFKKCRLNNAEAVVYGNGLQVRDFIHVSDVVNANMLAMLKPTSLVYNIGTSIQTSINDLVHLFELTAVHKEARLGEPMCSCADISLAQHELGFKAKIRLEETID